jgi:phosphoribosyl-ATP pyrophosphohydrolase
VGSAAGSYACKLIRDPDLLKAKLEEEATELAEAKSEEEIIWEAADVLFFTMMHMLRAGITIPDVERELERRRRIVKGKK